jgi:hypothetical protein
MRIGITCFRSSQARPTSLQTGGDLFADSDKTNTSNSQSRMAATIASPKSAPGRILRGATQQLISFRSKYETISPAIALSTLE